MKHGLAYPPTPRRRGAAWSAQTQSLPPVAAEGGRPQPSRRPGAPGGPTDRMRAERFPRPVTRAPRWHERCCSNAAAPGGCTHPRIAEPQRDPELGRHDANVLQVDRMRRLRVRCGNGSAQYIGMGSLGAKWAPHHRAPGRSSDRRGRPRPPPRRTPAAASRSPRSLVKPKPL